MSQSTQIEDPQPVMLTIAEAAQRLSIGRSMLYELMASGAIESIHIGRLRRIPVDCLTDFVDRRRRDERDQPR
ncbi:MAG: helix-turn-helix domain-containing protein [Cellulomonadaceae bacterium]|nr:helix-turn-helix domain-containing protein [Cellulomonadaceae bacterium]